MLDNEKVIKKQNVAEHSVAKRSEAERGQK
jgi:hypothetical protein